MPAKWPLIYLSQKCDVLLDKRSIKSDLLILRLSILSRHVRPIKREIQESDPNQLSYHEWRGNKWGNITGKVDMIDNRILKDSPQGMFQDF